jgi:hypothetical protein
VPSVCIAACLTYILLYYYHNICYMHPSHSIGSGTAIAVQAGAFHACILRADNVTTATKSGEVLCWGYGAQGQLVSLYTTKTLPHTCTNQKQCSSSTHTNICVHTHCNHHRLKFIHCISLTHCAFVAVAVISRNRAMATQTTLLISLLRYVCCNHC